MQGSHKNPSADEGVSLEALEGYDKPRHRPATCAAGDNGSENGPSESPRRRSAAGEKNGFFVGAAQVTLRIDGAFTLKDRRQVVRSLLDRLRARGLSACDVDGGEQVNAARLALAFVSADATLAQQALRDAVAFIESDGRAEIISEEYFLY